MIDFLLLVNYYYKKANCIVGDRVIMKILIKIHRMPTFDLRRDH